jgi:hypothetical protein
LNGDVRGAGFAKTMTFGAHALGLHERVARARVEHVFASLARLTVAAVPGRLLQEVPNLKVMAEPCGRLPRVALEVVLLRPFLLFNSHVDWHSVDRPLEYWNDVGWIAIAKKDLQRAAVFDHHTPSPVSLRFLFSAIYSRAVSRAQRRHRSLIGFDE